MTYLRLIIQSFRHYLWSHVSLMMGIVISTMVIVGALVVGDSVKYSLAKIAELRLGNTSTTLSAGNRLFTASLGEKMQGVPLLKLSGSALKGGGESRINNVQILGITPDFKTISNATFSDSLVGNRVAVSQNFAQGLNLKIGDSFLLRTEKASLTPKNAPFVSEETPSLAIRVIVNAVLTPQELGGFNLRNSQTPPYNVFINLLYLQERLELNERINTVLFSEIQDRTQALRVHLKPNDVGLTLIENTKQNSIDLHSANIFIDDQIISAFPKSSKHLTYFVNTIKHNQRSTPYSFVSTLPDSVLQSNEIVVNQWLADDLKVKQGDKIWLLYFLIGPLRELTVDSMAFVVKEVVAINGMYADQTLAPNIPGLSDAGNCSDWETGVPITLTAIRDKDEAYWDKHKGTPKAFINLQTAQRLWSNRFGSLSLLRFYNNSKTEIASLLKANTTPQAFGFTFNNVKEQALFAARNGVDFGQLFIGLSFFILVSGLILTVLLLSYHIKKRAYQMGTLSALGFTQKQIQGLLLAESSLSAILGVGLGILASIAYNKLIFVALNRVWNDIVRTQMLEVSIQFNTIVAGGIATFILVFITIYYSIWRSAMREVNEQQRTIEKALSKRRVVLFNSFSWILLVLICSVLGYVVLFKSTSSVGLFFALGTVLLAVFLFIFKTSLNKLKIKKSSLSGIWQLSLKNLTQNSKRSNSIVIMFALGAFLVVSTGLNRKDLSQNASENSSGTGGFMYFVETTLPVLKNFNSTLVQQEEGLAEKPNFVQFRKADGDDASCLNLNKISNPAILGVDSKALSGRFTLATSIPEVDANYPWESLSRLDLNGVVPAIADQTVIQWGLGLSVGDTLTYKTENGKTLKLLLVGGMANSIFQGYVIIDNTYFLEYFPSSSGSKIMLIEGDVTKKENIQAELTSTFRDYGVQIVSTEDRLKQFYSVENTYLAIFLVLGVLGLLLGIIGLGIVLAKSVMERRSEISLYLSLGFSQATIIRILSFEYIFLLSIGVLSGVISAVFATWPSLVSAGTEVSFNSPIQILSILIVSGVMVITSASLLLVYSKKPLSLGLNKE